MSRLERAIGAADDRKSAVFPEAGDGAALVVGGPMADRAVYSGFDLDYDELVETANRAGFCFVQGYAGLLLGPSRGASLQDLFVSAWLDGLLVGLMLASVAADEED